MSAVISALAALVDCEWARSLAYAVGEPLDDGPPSGKTITTKELCNVRVDDGWLKADDCRFTAVTGNPCTVAVWVTYDTGDKHMVCVADHQWLGIPLVPHGGDVGIVWPRQGIARLTVAK